MVYIYMVGTILQRTLNCINILKKHCVDMLLVVWNLIIPTDELIFFRRDRYTTSQI